MKDNEKMHLILEYMCSHIQPCYNTDEIAIAINLTLAETNILAKQILENGDAGRCIAKAGHHDHVWLVRLLLTQII